MRKKLLLAGILAMIGAIALIAGCAIEQAGGTEEEAVIAFAVGEDVLTAKTIEPSISMEILDYEFQWWYATSDEADPVPDENPDYTEVFSPKKNAFIRLVKPGKYVFRVNGYNGTETYPIGQDTTEMILLRPKETKAITLTLTPVDGLGFLDVTVQWPGVDFDGLTPKVFAYIYKFGEDQGDPVEFTTDMVGEKADYVTDGSAKPHIEDGYYKFKIKMVGDPGADATYNTDDDEILWTAMDVLRSVYNSTSSTIITLQKELDAFVPITIEEDMQNPIEITLNVDPDAAAGPALPVPYPPDDDFPETEYFTNPAGYNIKVQAFPLIDGTNIAVNTYEWYLNGAEITQPNPSITTSADFKNSTYVTGAGFPQGVYWIDVLVEKDGVLGSRRVRFIKE
jgi:hypothetical protein